MCKTSDSCLRTITWSIYLFVGFVILLFILVFMGISFKDHLVLICGATLSSLELMALYGMTMLASGSDGHAQSSGDVLYKMRVLNDMHTEGLITEDELLAKRLSLLEDL